MAYTFDTSKSNCVTHSKELIETSNAKLDEHDASNEQDEEGNNIIKSSNDEQDEEETSNDGITFDIRWGGKNIKLYLTSPDYETFNLLDLKTKILTELNIPLNRQKLLGIQNKDAPASDTDMLSTLTFRKSHTFWLVGTPAENAFVDPSSREDLPEVVNDLGWNYVYKKGTALSAGMKTHLLRLQKAIEKTNISVINNPRPNKKLLVLDLDYTLFDFKDSSNISDSKRPYLDLFMYEAYRNYDLAVWSQTHWRWVEVKCTELGFLDNPHYKLSFVLDRSSMFTVSSHDKKGNVVSHEVKALELIWRKFAGTWGPHNTLHVDDAGRNFALNPQNGIKVHSYRSHKRLKDRELLDLTAYLKMAADLADVRMTDHSNWRAVCRSHQAADDN